MPSHETPLFSDPPRRSAFGGNFTKSNYNCGAGSVKKLSGQLGETTRLGSREKFLNPNNPILTKEAPDGRHALLLGIVLAGDTALALVQSDRDINRSGIVFSVVELPFGEHAGRYNRNTGKTLLTLDPADLAKPREDGRLKPWESIRFGRGTGEIGDQTVVIGQDAELSRDHFVLTEHAEASILSVSDEHSTNGTWLISAQTLFNQPDNPILNEMISELNNPQSLAWGVAGDDTTNFEHHLGIPE